MSNGAKTETERNPQTEGKFPHLSKKDIISKIKKMKVMQNKKDGGEDVHDNEVNEEN